MKINWGTGIAIFYSLFVIVMVSMVIKSANHKPHMVQDNYYEADLNYEAFRQKRENANLAKDQVKVDYLDQQKQLRILFPNSQSSHAGQVTFFRPSNKHLDKTIDLKLDGEGQMLIPVDQTLPAGFWRVKIDWEDQGKQYYLEESIVL